MSLVRIQKYIADCGIASRRKAEQMILEGRVLLNNKKVTEMGVKVNPEEDVVSVDGHIITDSGVDKLYILFNKPRAVVSTVSDPEGRKTVMDFLPRIHQRIYPVGRLDYNSEGLIILTNDGEIAHKVMHPSFNVTKVYEVKVFGAIDQSLLDELKKPRQFEEGPVRPKSVRVIEQLPRKTWLEFRLTEGRNREIRRICEEVGIAIDKLRRVAIEGLTVQGLRPGDCRFLTKKEIDKMLGFNGVKASFVSKKRTIDLKQRGVQATRLANDKYYIQYRQDHFKKTMETRRLEAIKKEEMARTFKN